MWDYIIVGAGSAGCVLANRLSADPSVKVLLLEAGGEARGLRFRVPALGPLNATLRADSDWMLMTEPDPTRNDRRDRFPRGMVLGGSSAINGTIYVRGNPDDYNCWAKSGNCGWDYDSLVPFFKRLERDDDPTYATHGQAGPMRISRARGAHPLAYTFIDAMSELGVEHNPDYNGEDQLGASIPYVTQQRGWRWSAARGYLEPVRARRNLCVRTGALVRKVTIEDRRAVGVELLEDGRLRTERSANEVIISASAFNSPKLLMLSGIGDPEHLRSCGIPVIHPNTHVGNNLQEHPAVTVKSYVSVRTSNMDFNLLGKLRHGVRFGLFGSGQASYIFPAIAFVKLDQRCAYPELQFHFGAFAMDRTPQGPQMLDRPCVTLQPSVNRSRSRGSVRLASADPLAPPSIRPNMLSSRYDVDTLIAGIKFARTLLNTKAFSRYVVAEHAPGAGIVTDAEIESYIRASSAPCFHPAGSVRMGVDPAAVVDPRLRVIGIEKLRVVDSSIIPQLPSGNINAISMVIGEKGADMILQDRA